MSHGFSQYVVWLVMLLAAAVGAGGCSSSHTVSATAGAGGPEFAYRQHHTAILTTADVETSPADGGTTATIESPMVEAPFPFDEALLSWNVVPPPGGCARFDIRVSDSASGLTSPWLYMGRAGTAMPRGERLQRWEDDTPKVPAIAKIDIDAFSSQHTFDRVQFRIIAERCCANDAAIIIRRMAITFSGPGMPPAAAAASTPVAVPVPFRSQKTSDPSQSGRLCSPTSLAMVMAYRGIEVPVREVAAAAYDPDFDIYGNWPRNIEAAFELGVPGYLTRIGTWAQVQALLDSGQPIIASIKVKRGELTGSPYRETDGHLIVIRGIDENVDILVNDPAAATPAKGAITYRRDELTRVWLQRCQGTAYILLPREAAP